jgi:hypothetical protein
MEYAKIIEFPKDKSFRKRLQDKVQEQKTVLAFSIASVFLMTVFINQWMIDNANYNLASNAAKGDRRVASFESASFARDVKWEHDLAKRLNNSEEGISVNLAERPTIRDELVFGYLQGRYGMKIDQGRIASLDFIDAQAGERPLSIGDKSKFLKNYAAAFGAAFNEVSLVSDQNSKQKQSYNLINSSKVIIGQANFILDQEGRVQTIRFTHE